MNDDNPESSESPDSHESDHGADQATVSGDTGQPGGGGQSEPAAQASGGTAHASGQPQPAHQQAGISAALSRADVKYQIKYAVGIFAIVGLGFGLTGYVFSDVLVPGVVDSGGEFLKAIGIIGILVMTTLSGSIIGVVSALRVANNIDDDQAAYVASALGNAAGYVVMLIVTVLVLAATVSSGSETSASGGSTDSLLNLGDLLIPIFALSIPVAIVGLATVALHRRLVAPSGATPSAVTAD